MKVGLIDVDGGKSFPNLALMKISAYHKSRGDTVEWAYAMEHYDIIYQSKVFDETYSRDIDWIPNADVVIKGGTGYGLDNVLPDEIEHQYPDYGLYPEITKDTAYGFLTRGCPRHCEFCIVGDKEGLRSVKVADLSEFWCGQKYIKLLDPNLLCCKERLELLDQLSDSGAYVDFTQGLDIRLLTRENVILLNEIKVKEMPEINDDLAKDVSEFDTIDELKASIRESIEKQNEAKAKYETEDEAIEAVCNNAKVEIPSGMIELETENMEKDMESRLGYQGMNLDNYLQMIGKTRQEFRDEYKPQAEKQVKSRLVLEAVANDAKIEATEEEISSKIAEMAKMYGQKEEDVKNNEQLINYVKENLKTEKTIEYIVSNAKIK